MKRGLAAVLLLLAGGCDHLVFQGPAQVYAPWEEGLTLIFDNPSNPLEQKRQVRVKKSEDMAGTRTVVETRGSLSGQTDVTLRLHDGGVSTLDPMEPTVLPEGFPDRVSHWEERGSVYAVIGRARVDLPGVKLPDPEVIGVWVEEQPAGGGAPRRFLYVPDLGAVTTLHWKQGQWVTVARLVSRGFTDPPMQGSAR